MWVIISVIIGLISLIFSVYMSIFKIRKDIKSKSNEFCAKIIDILNKYKLSKNLINNEYTDIELNDFYNKGNYQKLREYLQITDNLLKEIIKIDTPTNVSKNLKEVFSLLVENYIKYSNELNNILKQPSYCILTLNSTIYTGPKIEDYKNIIESCKNNNIKQQIDNILLKL